MAVSSPFMRRVQASYRARHGDLLRLKPRRDVSKAQADRPMLMELAAWWHFARHSPSDRMVRSVYRNFIEETVCQYLELKELGLKFVVFDGPPELQPYEGPDAAARMVDDIERKHQLVIWPHASLPDDHPLGQPVHEAEGLSALVVFRGTHDALGHAPGGHNLTLTGEERAYCEHAQLYSDACRGAMATELRGPLAWLFFGEHLRRADGSFPQQGEPDYVEWSARPYPEQKATLLPPRFWRAAAIDEPDSISKVHLVNCPTPACAKAD